MVNELEKALYEKYKCGHASFIVMNKLTSIHLFAEISGIFNSEITIKYYEDLPIYISESLEFREFKIG